MWCRVVELTSNEKKYSLLAFCVGAFSLLPLRICHHSSVFLNTLAEMLTGVQARALPAFVDCPGRFCCT